MHFWINKPAGRYYGFTGRRYPATPVPKTRSNQCRRGGELRQMVTPVHIFPGLGTLGNAAGPSNVNSRRTIRPAIRSSNENRHRSSLNTAQFAQLNNIPNNVTDAGNNQLILSNAAASGTNRNLLGFWEFSDAESAGYRLRCGVWITFVLATGFVAAAKFYFGYRKPGLEILVFCGLLILILSACLYSIFCQRNQNHGRQEHRTIQEDHITTLTTANTSVGENIRAVPTVRQNPPPPYHIAILIPPPNTLDEAPPPSYDKIMR